jgi:hypothetical protein
MKDDNNLASKNNLKWIGVSVLYLSLSLMDGLLTYLNTPDLSREGNPLVMYGGMGWLGLFLVNIFFSAFFVLAAWYAFSRYQTKASPAKSWKEYISYIFYGRTDKFIWTFYKLPKIWKPAFALGGYSICWGAIASRAIVVFEWIMVTLNMRWTAYLQFRAFVPFKRVDLWTAIIVVIFLCFWWLIKQYRLSRLAVG